MSKPDADERGRRHIERAVNAVIVAVLWLPLGAALMTWGGWHFLLTGTVSLLLVACLHIWSACNAFRALARGRDA
jgi:hypothetical protein